MGRRIRGRGNTSKAVFLFRQLGQSFAVLCNFHTKVCLYFANYTEKKNTFHNVHMLSHKI
jgi:hypothetical protein